MPTIMRLTRTKSLFHNIQCSPIKSINNVVHIIFIIHLLFHSIHMFNLDTRIPVYKYGPRDSYFGYSVAEHMIRNKHEPWLLVGAPQDRHGNIRTGALYKCPLSTYTTDCEYLDVDPENSTLSLKADKNDQWLGVTVKSQGEGGYVMVCAHRYVHKGHDFRWGNGICYSLSEYLDYQRTFDPCRNRLVELAHEQFGYCQAGTSGDISKNFEIIIGSPGPYTWRGTIFVNTIRHSIKDDKTWYMGPVIEGDSPVSKYSYLGMSVATGDFFANGSIFASGAPRSNGTGEVIFYRKTGNNIFDFYSSLKGEQFASSFGYVMTSLDCDGDGHSDLAVGAPFFWNKNAGGAVYVYLSKDLRAGRLDKFQKLIGKPESRFGFSVANASDLNKDGFEDLAIGAPYEDSGVVYIFLGSISGIKSKPSQVIKAQTLPSPLNTLKTFGYSLSGNMDLDRNSYPDLLVGAYASDAIVLFRSRPIIKIKTSVEGNLTKIDPESKGCRDDRYSKTPCFTVRPCFSFLGKSSNFHSSSSLRYKIEAETFEGGKYYRVTFNSSKTSDTPNIVERTIYLGQGYKSEYCNTELIHLKNKQDILNPIAFKLTYSLIQSIPRMPDEGDNLPSIDNYPILDQEEAQRIFYAKFIKECGSDDVCNSKLSVKANLLKATKLKKNNFKLNLTEEEIIVDIHVINKGESAYDVQISIDHSVNLSFIGTSKTQNVDCSIDARSKQLICLLNNPFNRGSVDFQLRFNGINIQDYEREIFIDIKANTTSEDDTLNDNSVRIRAEIERTAELVLNGVSVNQHVFFGGVVKGESAIKFEDEIGHKVIHKYTVTNKGPWRARRITVSIKWPLQLESNYESGKWLLYITSKPEVNERFGHCDLDSRYINPKNFIPVYDDNKGNRSRRSNKKSVVDRDSNVNNIVKLSCDSRAKCIEFHCFLNLGPNTTAFITIPSRLWNATFLEEFPTDHVKIYSNAKIMLNPNYNIVQSTVDDTFSVETEAVPDKLSQLTQQVSIWYYLIAILFGLLLLAVIIIVLIKVGFFKRSRPPGIGYESVNTNDISHEAT